ncbi:MAG: nucleotidyltransferase family protein [Elusimicrobiota bacterium]
MDEAQAYLLAAGKGKRAGGPKAWIAHEDGTLLGRQVAFLTGLFAPGAVAVTVQEAWLERCRGVDPGVRWVPVDPGASPLHALQAALKAAPLTKWGCLHHVDMPVWEGTLFRDLLTRAREADEAGVEAIIPVHDGKGGHPVLLSPRLGEALLALDPDKDRLDRFLRGRFARRVEVSYPCVLENWNAGRPR